MDFQIALMLGQDGLTNGAVYALLALALVLVFAVTRVIFIPQGEFVAYGALTLAMMQSGGMPAAAWMLLGLGGAVIVAECPALIRAGDWRRLTVVASWNLLYPLAMLVVFKLVPTASLPLLVQMGLSLALIVPLAPMLYRLIYEPLASASILILLIVSVALHLAMVGLALFFFGPEGQRTPALSDALFEVAGLVVSGQSLCVLGVSLALILALYAFFEHTLYGKALRATAINRTGARLMGISPTLAGKMTFSLAALIGALSGMLIAPITTMYYDSGFLIGLKGFVAAIIGGLASYPLAAIGALLVGLLESFSSFWDSAYKEVTVFTLIIPVLLWRSLNSHHVEEEE